MIMDKKTQDILWSSLPKADREVFRKTYATNSATRLDCCQERAFILDWVFNSHNLTSDTEPTELLQCSRDFVMGRYKHLTSSIAWNEGDARAFKAEISLLKELFGDKCLPDKESPVQGEPKFKVGDLVICLTDGQVYEVDGKTGKHHYALKGSCYDAHEDNLEPYTEPETIGPECIHPDSDNCKWKNICDHTQCYFDSIKPETNDNMEEKELNRKALYDALCELESASIKVRKALIPIQK